AGPSAARWSDTPIGPDGPWNAVTVTMGSSSPGQNITIYPGKMWESYFPGSTYCLSTMGTGLPCYANNIGGLYNELTGTGQNLDVNFPPNSYFTDNMPMTGLVSPQLWVETLHLGGNASATGPLVVTNLSMALIRDTQLQYPSGKKYPIFAGCLALGAAPGMANQSFADETGTGSGSTNASLLAGSLFAAGDIDSNSFGLHIGSIMPTTIPGSLWFGGYDKSRAVNDMLSLPIRDPYTSWTAALVDISITVIAGGSPFPWRSKSGLLASGKSSMEIDRRLDLEIDPCTPYLNLPKSTCDALAAELPVTYDEGLGLYLWNTWSIDYHRIVQSASALTFTFIDPNNSNLRGVINISVPFMHLNLTLEEPLVDQPTAYFPCYAITHNDKFALGRAFLQDAFIGANFEKAVYFLAQAPGAGSGYPDIKVIERESTTLKTSGGDWTITWQGIW
ncbi:aspartic peptidase domain-containing protein, partial [Pseudomassariella vexata]